jgi:hypothetical protein
MDKSTTAHPQIRTFVRRFDFAGGLLSNVGILVSLSLNQDSYQNTSLMSCLFCRVCKIEIRCNLNSFTLTLVFKIYRQHVFDTVR